MATTINGSGIEFSGGGLSLPLKNKTLKFYPASQNWSDSLLVSGLKWMGPPISDVFGSASVQDISDAITADITDFNGVNPFHYSFGLNKNAQTNVVHIFVTTTDTTFSDNTYIILRLWYV